jgi:hypothetical protein
MKRMKMVLVGLAFVFSGALLKGGEAEEFAPQLLTPQQLGALSAEQKAYLEYLHLLPKELVFQIASESIDPDKPLQSLLNLKVILGSRSDTVGALYNLEFMYPIINEIALKKYYTLYGWRPDTLIDFVVQAEMPVVYEWFAQKASFDKAIKFYLLSELRGFIDHRTDAVAKNDYHFSSKKAIKELRFLDAMLALQVFSPDQLVLERRGVSQTAYYAAKTRGDSELADLLLHYGADPSKSILSNEEFRAHDAWITSIRP